MTCMSAGKENNILLTVDGGKWFQKKVQEVLGQSKSVLSDNIAVPVLPVLGWKPFPSGPIPKDFCYGNIYNHIITTARLHNAHDGQVSDENTTDFNTSKPMTKGRQYFLSGHVTKLHDTRKSNFFFLRGNVMASYTQSTLYNVSVTLFSDGSVADASCECKASAMGRCSHVAAVLFALEDYTMQFGFDKPASTSELCKWNVGRKRKNPQPAHMTKYNKKAAPDRILNFDPRSKDDRTEEADNNFMNNFIRNLPNVGNETMFSHVLEAEYDDYEVDKCQLQEFTKYALDQQENQNTDSGPREVPGTKGQTDSTAWHQARALKVTASIAKEATTIKTDRGLFNFLNRNLWGMDRPDTSSMRYGKENEDNAFRIYKSDDGYTAEKAGFWVNSKYPELGCSPDGTLHDNGKMVGVIEIKCPQVLKNTHPLHLDNLKPSQKNNLCYKVVDGKAVLKKTHSYYCQVQTQIAVCDVSFCDFIIWTPKGVVIEKIERDYEFWDMLYPKLKDFFRTVLLPEYMEMRVPRRLMPVRL